jgi:hypothetical protein
MNRREISDSIETITSSISQLEIKCGEIQSDIVKARNLLTKLNKSLNAVEEVTEHNDNKPRRTKREKNIIQSKAASLFKRTSSNFKEGDYVSIRNPNPGQSSEGEIYDFCKDGKAQIATINGNIIRGIYNLDHKQKP